MTLWAAMRQLIILVFGILKFRLISQPMQPSSSLEEHGTVNWEIGKKLNMEH